MSKTKISEFSTTPGNNTDINGINIAEGCAPSGINNAIRELMSDLKEWQSGAMDVYVIPQGTAAAPGIQLYGDLDTGLYGYAANQLGVAVGGASAGYFSSAGWVGNVNGTITGDINATTIDTTNLEVTNIKAKDGTAAITIDDSTGAVTLANAVTMSATTQNIALGTSQTTGTYTVGGTAQTGTQSIGRSTKTHTFNVATGATESGATKTVNIATAGVSGSTTTISIGSSVSGATSNTTLSGNVTATRDMTVNGITVGKGKGSEGSNTAIGLSALAAFNTGESSTAIGQYALWKATTSAFNTAVGAQSQLNSLTGGYNTSVGALTLNTATAGFSNVAIGFSALNLATGDNNTAVGNGAGSLITTGAKNTIIGNYTGNQGGLDITTSSNYIVLSDGDGNPRAYWNGANATFGGTLTATTITGTQVNSDNLRLDGNTLSSTDTNGNIVIAPNGTGQVQLSGALDVTNIEVTNIKAKDGTAALSIADSTGAVTVATAFAANGGVTIGDASGDALTINSSAVSTPNGLNFDSDTFVIDATNNRVGINNASPTVALDVTGALTISGNAILGDASTDTVTVNGYMGVGGAASSNAGINVVNTALTGTVQYGVVANPTGTSSATSQINASWAGAKTAAASFTSGNVSGYRVADATKGAGSTITNLHGLYVEDQTQGTNNYGITSLVSSGTNKWNIYASGTAANYFAGNVGIGTSSPGEKLQVVGNATVSGGITSSGGDITVGTAGKFVYSNYVSQNSGSSLYLRGATASGQIEFQTNTTTKATLDSSGNLGLGVTPGSWASGAKAMQVSSLGMVWQQTNGDFNIGYNTVETTANAFVYKLSSIAATRFSASDSFKWYVAPSGTAGNAITFTQALTLDANRNLLLNGTSAGASAVGTFAIFNGTAPTGSVTNGVILYAEDVSSSSELKVRDEAGNVTTLSPHNFSLIPEGPSEDMAWAYYSEKGGKRINVDMLKLARMVEKLTGEKLVYES